MWLVYFYGVRCWGIVRISRVIGSRTKDVACFEPIDTIQAGNSSMLKSILPITLAALIIGMPFGTLFASEEAPEFFWSLSHWPDGASDLAATSDHGFVIVHKIPVVEQRTETSGPVKSHLVVTRYGADKESLWQQKFPQYGAGFLAIAPDDSVFVAAQSFGPLIIRNGRNTRRATILLISLSPDGRIMWTKKIEGTSEENRIARGLGINSSLQLLLGGITTNLVNQEKTIESASWLQTWSTDGELISKLKVKVGNNVGAHFPVHIQEDGRWLGRFLDRGQGQDIVTIFASFDPAGKVESRFIVPGTAIDEVVDSKGNILAITRAVDWKSWSHHKFTASGEALWTQPCISSDAPSPSLRAKCSKIIVDSCDGVFLIEQPIPKRVLVKRLDNSGQELWSKGWNDKPGHSYRMSAQATWSWSHPPYAIMDAEGHFIVAHTVDGTLTLRHLKSMPRQSCDPANSAQSGAIKHGPRLGISYLGGAIVGAGYNFRRLNAGAVNSVEVSAGAMVEYKHEARAWTLRPQVNVLNGATGIFLGLSAPITYGAEKYSAGVSPTVGIELWGTVELYYRYNFLMGAMEGGHEVGLIVSK